MTADTVSDSRAAFAVWASAIDVAVYSVRFDVWQALRSQTEVLNACVAWLNFLVRRDGVLRGTVLLNGLAYAGPLAVNVLTGSGVDPNAAGEVAAISRRLPPVSFDQQIQRLKAPWGDQDARLRAALLKFRA